MSSIQSMALRPISHHLHGFKDQLRCSKTTSCLLRKETNALYITVRSKVICAVSMTKGNLGDHEKSNLNLIANKVQNAWEKSPEPVKTFPWNRVLENFIQTILDLFIAVTKYLCIPIFAISSLSELSYCAHEKKLFLVPYPLLLGVIIAGVLKKTALELSPLLKDAEVPWHLVSMTIFFVLLKFPGPYYPYWGRIFVPHFANGGLLMTLYSAFQWFRKPKKMPDVTSPDSS